jgi:hypothetical protein
VVATLVGERGTQVAMDVAVIVIVAVRGVRISARFPKLNSEQDGMGGASIVKTGLAGVGGKETKGYTPKRYRFA